MSDDDFEEALEQLQEDPHIDDLLPILNEQINILVHEGRTNLPLFLTSLESQSIVTSEEASELRVKLMALADVRGKPSETPAEDVLELSEASGEERDEGLSQEISSEAPEEPLSPGKCTRSGRVIKTPRYFLNN
jgi:hypothetical protein